MARPLQSHGRNSKVYVPVLLHIFKQKYREGDTRITFDMEDIRQSLKDLGLTSRNPADVIYRMKARTQLPDEIQQLGFRILRPIDRGRYSLEVGDSTLVEFPEGDVELIYDRTPPVVRRMIGAELGDIDEQALLSVLRYNDLLGRFLNARVFHLKGHVRKSVEGVGQAEVDDVHLAVPHGADAPIDIIPVEAKAKDEPINRAQIVMQVLYARTAFPGHQVRPLTVKLFEDGVILLMEFTNDTDPRSLRPIRFARYRLRELSDTSEYMISENARVKPAPNAR